MTVDETWVHHYQPEDKAQSRQWVGPGPPMPKKFRRQASAGKVMATVFWDAEGVIMLDFLPRRSTITRVYDANVLDQQRTAIRKKNAMVNSVLQKLLSIFQQKISVYLVIMSLNT